MKKSIAGALLAGIVTTLAVGVAAPADAKPCRDSKGRFARCGSSYVDAPRVDVVPNVDRPNANLPSLESPSSGAVLSSSQSSCQTLRAQADTDAPKTSSQAVGLWVPQLSSKRPGLVAEGTLWDCISILAEHQRLRNTDYGAALLWSGDWPNTYRNNDYWVTVAKQTFPDSDGVKRWCANHGLDRDHCLPVQIKI